MNVKGFIWRFSDSGYRLLRFFDRLAVNLSKPRRSLVNLHPKKKEKARQLLKQTDRLHLGCGTVRLHGFINIDAVFTPAVDFRCKLHKLYDYFPPGSVSEIYICHTMEHLPARLLPLYLKQFYSILKKDGVLRISVPDIEKCMVAAGKQQWTDEQIELLQGVIGGGQDHKYNYHKSFFWPEYLARKLERAGFVDIAEYPLQPHFAGPDVNDSSNCAGFHPYGMGLSLNMKARK
ncbi:MAG: methyltransferase [Thermodesulfobacteriota bacterium]|nr:methyltransferase [Thermodesulfobacteriota bacterium]